LKILKKFKECKSRWDIFKTLQHLQHCDEDAVRSNCCWPTSWAGHCVQLFLYENDKSEVPPPQNSCNISEKENYLTIIRWSVVSVCHDVNEMDMLIYRWNTWWDTWNIQQFILNNRQLFCYSSLLINVPRYSIDRSC
jgi:hypothetical protein